MSDIATIDETLAAAVDDLFADRAPAAHEAIDAGAPSLELWGLVEQLGFTRIGIDESLGGSGGSLIDLLPVLVAAARHAAPVPLAENFLAATLLCEAAAELPQGLLTVAPPGHTTAVQQPDGTSRVAVRQVPWAHTAARVVALVPTATEARIVVGEPTDSVRSGENLAGEPVAELELADVHLDSLPVGSLEEHFWLGALCRSAQIAGALQTVAELTRQYCEERVQFGKPIGRFQAVQQHVVTVAQSAAIASTQLWLAAHAWVSDAPNRSFEVACAKLVANEAARVAARAAHQAHGAMGMTREYPLHRYTRRLALWRMQYGTERSLAESIGAAVSTQASFARALSDTEPELTVTCPT